MLTNSSAGAGGSTATLWSWWLHSDSFFNGHHRLWTLCSKIHWMNIAYRIHRRWLQSHLKTLESPAGHHCITNNNLMQFRAPFEHRRRPFTERLSISTCPIEWRGYEMDRSQKHGEAMTPYPDFQQAWYLNRLPATPECNRRTGQDKKLKKVKNHFRRRLWWIELLLF